MPTASQITAANEIYRIATNTTAAQRGPMRSNIASLQRQMGLSVELSDGLIGRSTARAVFDLTGRRIPGIDISGTPSPVLAAPPPTSEAQPERVVPPSETRVVEPSPTEPLQASLTSQFSDASSFFERHKTLLLLTGGLIVATGVAAYLMTSAEGEKSAMDNATLRYAARQLGISPDSDVQSIRAAAARALQAYPDDKTRRDAIIEARDVMIRARSQRSPSGRSVSSRGRKMSYEIVTSGLGGR